MLFGVYLIPDVPAASCPECVGDCFLSPELEVERWGSGALFDWEAERTARIEHTYFS